MPGQFKPNLNTFVFIRSACLFLFLLASACSSPAPIAQVPVPTAISLSTETPSPRAVLPSTTLPSTALPSITSLPATLTSTYDLNAMVTRGVATYSAQQTQWALTETTLPSHTPVQATLTPWIEIYPVKHALIRYITGGGRLSDMDAIYPTHGFTSPKLIVYTDGQLIYQDSDGNYWQKQLSKNEVNGILTDLKQLGFFDVKDNGQRGPKNPIYHFGPGDYQEIWDGLYTQITVYGDHLNKIVIYEPFNQIVIQPLKAVLSYLDHFRPTGATRYEPDRLLLLIHDGREDWTDPAAPAVPWPAEITPITEHTPAGFLFLQ